MAKKKTGKLNPKIESRDNSNFSIVKEFRYGYKKEEQQACENFQIFLSAIIYSFNIYFV